MTPTNHDGKDAALIRSPIRFCISGPNEPIPTVYIDIDAISGNTILKTLLDDKDRFQSEDLVVLNSRCQFPNLSGVGSSSGLATKTPKFRSSCFTGRGPKINCTYFLYALNEGGCFKIDLEQHREYSQERMDGWMEAIAEELYQAVELIERVWSKTVRWHSRSVAQAAHRTSETRSHRKRVPKENRRIPLSASASGNGTIGHRLDWTPLWWVGQKRKRS